MLSFGKILSRVLVADYRKGMAHRASRCLSRTRHRFLQEGTYQAVQGDFQEAQRPDD